MKNIGVIAALKFLASKVSVALITYVQLVLPWLVDFGM